MVPRRYGNYRFDLSPYVARLLSHHLAHWSDRKSDGLHLTMLILGPVGTVLDPLFQILPQHVERPFSGAVDAKGRDGQGVCCRLALGNPWCDVEHLLGNVVQGGACLPLVCSWFRSWICSPGAKKPRLAGSGEGGKKWLYGVRRHGGVTHRHLPLASTTQP